jgi:hypothetical protein
VPAEKNDPGIGVHDVAPEVGRALESWTGNLAAQPISRFSAVHKRCARAANAQLLYPKVKRGALDT